MFAYLIRNLKADDENIQKEHKTANGTDSA
jgi:hypothetical protein